MPNFWQLSINLKTQNSIISFGYVDSYAKIFLILFPPLENSITHIAILLTKMCYCFWLYGNFFQRIDKVSDEGEFSLAKFSSSCQLSDDTQLVKKRLFEESFSENLLKLQVSMLSDLKQTCLFSLIFRYQYGQGSQKV